VVGDGRGSAAPGDLRGLEMSRARGVVPDLPPHVQVKWVFRELTPYAVTGDPTKATREKGRRMRDALVDLLVSFLREMDRRGWELSRPESG